MSQKTASARGGVDLGNLSQAVHNRLLPAGAVAANFAQQPGARAMNILRVAANVVEGETVLIGGNTFEVDIVNTDTGVNTAAGEWNNVLDPIQVTVTAHALVAGDLLRVENEIVKIMRVIDANTLVVARGRCGTTTATHADGLDIFKSATPPASNIPVGLVTTLTPAVFTPALADEINNPLTVTSKERVTAKASTIFGQVQATSLQAGVEMLLEAVSAGVLALATTETLAGVNNAWSNATMVGGLAGANAKHQFVKRVPTADEVALGFMRFSFPFTPAKVVVAVIITASGIAKGWVGGFQIVGNRVDVDNAGATDWAVTDTVYVLAEE